MKKSNYLKPLHLLILIITLGATGCITKKEDDKDSKVPDPLTLANAKTLLDSLKVFEANAHAFPVGYNEYVVLHRERSTAYTYGNNALPGFVDALFNASDMYSYLKALKTAGYDGVRVYPCFIVSNEIAFALCGAKLADTSETSYKLIENYDYTAINDAVNKITTSKEQVVTAHKEYLSKIKIYGLTQPPYGETSDAYRKSRYYEISNIFELMKDNIPGLDFATEPDFKNYKIKLETGFVSTGLIEVFRTRCENTDSPLHQFGYTMIWKIHDDKRASTLDPDAKFSKCDEYNKRALEVGHPCPPRCGALHPAAK